MTKLIFILTALLVITGIACGDVVYPPENTIHVSLSGSDANNGSCWALAKRTVQAGLNAAVGGYEVWVAEGAYYERITHKAGVGLYGGFDGTEVSRSQRNWQAHPTVLDGSRGGSVVTIGDNVSATTIVDGFTIRNGDRFMGGGIMISGYSCTPVIQNNIITGNYAGTWGGGGIYVEYASPAIRFNTISNNQTYGNFGGGGINVYCGSPVITNNRITGNTSTGFGGGVYVVLHWAVVANNIIAGNSAAWMGGGVFVNTAGDNTPTIANNTIVGNQVTGTGPDKGGGGIGLSCYNDGVIVKNNIVANNSSGIFNRESGIPDTATNCVYGNTAYNYLGLTSGTDLWDDPLLNADYHLQDGSACIDTGTNSIVGSGWVDIDGGPRILDTFDYGNAGVNVDIGADEFCYSLSDTTAPGPPNVGASAVCDNGSSTLTLQADWYTYDGESGIAECMYAVGTSAGGIDVVGWTSTLASSATIPGLPRSVGATYYVSVKARNGAGLWGPPGTSPAVTVTDVWAIDPLIKVFRDKGRHAQATDGVQIEAVRNEYESVQVVVTAGSSAISYLRASVGEIMGPFGPLYANPQVHYVGYVPVRCNTALRPWLADTSHLVGDRPVSRYYPTWFPDPLKPSAEVPVAPGNNSPVWVTLRIPKSAPAGTYTGTISVQAGAVTTNVPLMINIHDAELVDLHPDPSDPGMNDRPRLSVTQWFNVTAYWHTLTPDRWDWTLIDEYADIMAEHRQNVISTPCLIHETSLIQAHEDVAGTFTFDFSWFDQWVNLFKQRGVLGVPGSPTGDLTGLIESYPLGYGSTSDRNGNTLPWHIAPYGPMIHRPDGTWDSCWRPEVDVNGTDPDDEAYRDFMRQYLPALRDHLIAMGWWGNFVQHIGDEPNNSNAAAWVQFAQFVKSCVPDIRLLEAVQTKNLVGSIDVWVPLTGSTANPGEVDSDFDHNQSFYAARKAAGEEVWFYTCCWPTTKYMNRFIDYRLIDTRLLHWANFQYDVKGYLNWALYQLGPTQNPYEYTDLEIGNGVFMPPGDAFMVYPTAFGTDKTPISCIRLEAMRDGIEDYELLRSLEELDPTSARSISGSVVWSLTDTAASPGCVSDPATFNSRRLQLIEELELHSQ